MENKFPVLETVRLVLREFKPSDTPAVFDIFSRPEVIRFTNHETMTLPEQADKLVAARAGMFEKQIGIRWAITVKNGTARVIGSCGFFNLNPAFHLCEVGYDLHPDCWNKGIATEAVNAAIGFAYADQFFFDLNRIFATTFEENVASIRVLEKLGFKKEGIQREVAYWKGSFHDLLALSLLRRDWKK